MPRVIPVPSEGGFAPTLDGLLYLVAQSVNQFSEQQNLGRMGPNSRVWCPSLPLSMEKGCHGSSSLFLWFTWAIIAFEVERVQSEGVVGGEAEMWHSQVVVSGG
jgi:hypothetical protein